MLVDWTPRHVADHLPAYRAVSADVSNWGEREFLSDLPGKWELSFGLWEDGTPVAYCVLSRKFGSPHIHQLMVTPSLRGRGVGVTILEEARRRGARSLKVSIQNDRAIQFYERAGWTKAEMTDTCHWMRHP